MTATPLPNDDETAYQAEWQAASPAFRWRHEQALREADVFSRHWLADQRNHRSGVLVAILIAGLSGAVAGAALVWPWAYTLGKLAGG